MDNNRELEPLFKAIEENDKENSYVTKAFKKYLPFIFIEDVLNIKFKNKALLVVPKSLRYEIISLSHGEWYSGHFGIFKTIQRIYNSYWWPTVKEDVTNFISTCKICLSIKTPNRSCGKMGRRKRPTAPLESVSLDFLVDLLRTTKGNVHLLVINDHFTKLIKLYAIKRP